MLNYQQASVPHPGVNRLEPGDLVALGYYSGACYSKTQFGENRQCSSSERIDPSL